MALVAGQRFPVESRQAKPEPTSRRSVGATSPRDRPALPTWPGWLTLVRPRPISPEPCRRGVLTIDEGHVGHPGGGWGRPAILVRSARFFVDRQRGGLPKPKRPRPSRDGG